MIHQRLHLGCAQVRLQVERDRVLSLGRSLHDPLFSRRPAPHQHRASSSRRPGSRPRSQTSQRPTPRTDRAPEAEGSGQQVGGKLPSGRVVGSDGIVVTLTCRSQSVLRTLQLILEPDEVLVRLELGIAFDNGKQVRECARELVRGRHRFARRTGASARGSPWDRPGFRCAARGDEVTQATPGVRHSARRTCLVIYAGPHAPRP